MNWRDAASAKSHDERGPGMRDFVRFASAFWKILRMFLGYATLVAMSLFSLFPFLWMVSTSLKSLSATFAWPPKLLPNPPLWSNYGDVVRSFPILTFALNSAYIAVTSTVGQVLVSSMAAFAFARMRFKGRDALFLLYLGTMMIPSQVTLIPVYVMMSKIGWVNTYQALIVPRILGGVYGTFLIRQSFLGVPKELEDAAIIDGASPIWIYVALIMPLSKAVLATLTVFTFMWTWNDFLWPLLMIDSTSKMTLTLGISFLSRTRYYTDWPHLMAGTCMSIVPVLILLWSAQRYFTEGIRLTGLKA